MRKQKYLSEITDNLGKLSAMSLKPQNFGYKEGVCALLIDKVKESY